MIRLLTALYRADRPLLWRFRLLLAGLVGLGLIEGLTFVLLVPVLSALFEADFAATRHWGLTLAALAALYGAMLGGLTWLAARIGTETLRLLYRRLGDHLALLPLGWFDTERAGQLGQLVAKGAVEIAGVPRHLLRPVIGAIVAPVTIAIAMLLLDWRIGLVLLAAVPLMLAFARQTNAHVARASAHAEAAAADANARVVEFARHQAVLRAFGRTVERYGRLDDALTRQSGLARRVLLGGALRFELFLVALQAVLCTVVMLCLSLMLEGGLSIAAGMALLVLTVRFVEPFANAADLGASIRVAEDALGRINDLLATAPLPEPALPRPARGNDIVFDAVGFGYEPGCPILRDVSFTATAGTVTALVGPSGAGKTTLLRLIARFFDPQSGAILLGGTDLRDLGSAEVMRRIAMVFQDVYLFEGSIRDNIRIGRPEATDAEIDAAARLARVDEIVARLPEGWETPVGENGGLLSGGERQRISIARAILKDAPILLLDEATAALDPENESAIQHATAMLARNRTVIVIAHRLNTIQAAGRIVVLENGRVTEQGNHAELLRRREGAYARFWTRRHQAAGWRLHAETAADRAHAGRADPAGSPRDGTPLPASQPSWQDTFP